MKRYILLALLFSVSVLAQDDKNLILAEPDISPPPKTIYPLEDAVYTTAQLQVQPEFQGGITEFLNFIYANIQVPESDTEINVRAIVNFIVEKDGKITNVKIVRDPGHDLINEIERVVGLSPNWKPGIKNGTPVRVSHYIPVPLIFGGKNVIVPENFIYTMIQVDTKPQFKEGPEKFMKLFSQKFTLPRNIKQGGRFIVPIAVIVEKDGSMTGANVLAHGENGIEEEMERVIQLLPKWSPAEKDGKPVRCRMVISIPLVIRDIDSTPMKQFDTP